MDVTGVATEATGLELAGVVAAAGGGDAGVELTGAGAGATAAAVPVAEVAGRPPGRAARWSVQAALRQERECS